MLEVSGFLLLELSFTDKNFRTKIGQAIILAHLNAFEIHFLKI